MALGRRSTSTTKAAGRTAVKALEEAEKGAGKAARKAVKQARKSARRSGVSEITVHTERAPFSAAQAKRLIGVGTAVLPLLAPYALTAATRARGHWDAYRADRLGVRTDQLTAFRGPGGPLHARLSRLAEALTDLEKTDGRHTTTAATRFTAETRPRVTDLAVAVRAAEQMPATRRRAAFKAIDGELQVIEITLLGHLGVTA
jgi:hypothetical protein